jgi:hypothetical protein
MMLANVTPPAWRFQSLSPNSTKELNSQVDNRGSPRIAEAVEPAAVWASYRRVRIECGKTKYTAIPP